MGSVSSSLSPVSSSPFVRVRRFPGAPVVGPSGVLCVRWLVVGPPGLVSLPASAVCGAAFAPGSGVLRAFGLARVVFVPVPAPAPAPAPARVPAPAPAAVLVSVSSAVWSAFRSGGLVRWGVRPSVRSSSGAVAVLSFSSPAAAGRFAARAARRAGVSVAVRPAAGCWSVSVPVPLPSSSFVVSFPAGLFAPLSGGFAGVRGLALALRGFAVVASGGVVA
jgi:hypothetical protein